MSSESVQNGDFDVLKCIFFDDNKKIMSFYSV